MVEFGYSLSSEEHPPRDLARFAGMAEDAGFTFALISDHYHPWVTRQGQSPFVWTVLGAIAQSTKQLKVGTGVTCPILRQHPGLVAQAAATVADMMPGRFFLGLGAGENLNEHVFGDAWPRPGIRHEMLCEAIDVIRGLWQGETFNHDGVYYTVDEAKLFTLPEQPPAIYIAAGGPEAAELAAHQDGLVGVAPDRKLIEAFEQAGGQGKPRFGQVGVCWAESEEEARQTVLDVWPNGGLPGDVNWEIKTVEQFDLLTKDMTAEKATKGIPCGPDPEVHVQAIRKFIDAGYDHVYLHQFGPKQEEFMRFYQREVLPKLGWQPAQRAAA